MCVRGCRERRLNGRLDVEGGMEVMRRDGDVPMPDVHDERGKVRRLHRSGRLVGGHAADEDRAELDTGSDHRLRTGVSVRAARRRAEGANDKTKD